MPTTTSQTIVFGASEVPEELSPIERMRVRADALCRAAAEVCHQHERIARLAKHPALEAEHRIASQLCTLSDQALQEMVVSYEKAAARLVPDAEDLAWWRRANTLWFASREYQVHHGGCDSISRHLPDRRTADDLNDLHIEYELEASALLALRQSVDAYRKERPVL